MVIPLGGSIGHSEVDLSCRMKIRVLSFLSNLHSSIEMFGSSVVVSLLCKQLSQLHKCATLTLSVFEFTWKFQVSLHEHLQLVLVHLGVHLVSTNLSKVTDGDTLASHTRHLDSIPESKLMVDWWLLMIACLVVNDTQVNMGQKFTCDICYLLVTSVEIDCILVEFWFLLTKFHVVDTDAVVCKCFTVYITNGFAHLEELLVLVDGILELAEVVLQHTCGVVGTTFISWFSSSLAGEGKNVIVFQSLLGCNSVVWVRVGHLEACVLAQHLIGQFSCPIGFGIDHLLDTCNEN